MPVVNPQIRTDLSNARIATNPQFYGQVPTNQATYMTMGAGQAQRNTIQQATDRIQSMAGTTAFVFPHDEPKYWMHLAISAYSRNSIAGSDTINTTNGVANIRLPIPTQLEDVQHIDYDTSFAFGPAWGAAINAGSGAYNSARASGSTPFEAAGQAGIEAAEGGIRGTVGSLLGTADNAVLNAATLNAAGAIGGAIRAFEGLAVNQFYTVLLKGPAFKTYTLDWVLQPRTQAESTTIRNIIRILRGSAAPGLHAPTGGALWTFPDVVTPTFVPQGNGVDTYMYRFKPAVMTDVGAVYNPFGTPAFYRGPGAPESVRLTIHFLELEYWIKDNF